MDTKASRKNEVLLTPEGRKKAGVCCVKSEIVTRTIKVDMDKNNCRIIELSCTFFTVRSVLTILAILRLTISARVNLIVKYKT